MKKLWIVWMLTVSAVSGQDLPPDEVNGAEDTVATFSIVARDPATGELGLAVQSRAFRAGRTVPYGKPGVGMIASQAGAARTPYGRKGMEMLEAGLSPEEIIERLTKPDEGRGVRQVAVIDNQGRVKAYTGAACGEWAGHIEGEQFSVQGNILAGEEVVRAMARTFERTKGELAERLMAVLEAGQAAGGDARGMQAGAIWVMEPYHPSHETEGSDRYRGVDIRVDDSPDPFKELRSLLNITLAGRHSRMSRRLAEEGKFRAAIEAQEKARSLNPADNVVYGLAQRYAQAGDATKAIGALAEAIARNPRWKALAARNAAFDKIKDHQDFKKLVQED